MDRRRFGQRLPIDRIQDAEFPTLVFLSFRCADARKQQRCVKREIGQLVRSTLARERSTGHLDVIVLHAAAPWSAAA